MKLICKKPSYQEPFSVWGRGLQTLKNYNMTLDHKTSLKTLGYICSNSQKYIV